MHFLRDDVIFLDRKICVLRVPEGKTIISFQKHPNPRPNPLLPLSIANLNFLRILVWETIIRANRITNHMVIGTKLKKFYQKNNNIIKKITSTNSNGLIFKIYKEKKIDWFSHQPNKVQKQQQSNKPNTTSRLHNTELRLRLSFVFILYLCFKVRISFWCFRKF